MAHASKWHFCEYPVFANAVFATTNSRKIQTNTCHNCHHRSLVHQSRVMDSWHKKSEQSEHMSLTQSQLGGNHAEGSLNHSTQPTQITKRFTSRSRSQEGDLRAPAGRCACVKALIYIYK